MSRHGSEPVREADDLEARRPSGWGGLARLYWMLLGNAIVGYTSVAIAQHTHSLSWRDLLFWSAATSLVAVRYLDVTVLGGTTADGARAMVSHWRRYSIVVLLVSAGCWAAAHAVAFVMGK